MLVMLCTRARCHAIWLAGPSMVGTRTSSVFAERSAIGIGISGMARRHNLTTPFGQQA